MSRVRASFVRAVAVLAAVILGVTLGAAPAFAVVTTISFGDDFERDTGNTWTFMTSGGGTGWVYTNDPGLAGAGSGGVILKHPNSGFTSFGRLVHIPLNNTTCWGNVHVQRRSYGNTVKVNFEVIKPDTWTYIKLKSLNLNGPGTGLWQEIGIGSFSPPVGAFYLRISIIGVDNYTAIANFDDLAFDCQFTR